MKKVLEEIRKAVKKAKTALIATHIDPDGDAIGSQVALGMLLEKMGLSVSLYCADEVPRVYRFLAGTERVKREVFPQEHFDLVFVVDCSALNRVGDKLDLRQLSEHMINIDHHPDNALFGDINFVMKTSSVSEEIYEIFKYFEVKIDEPMAECLYTAMITDNGNFRYENTTPKTFTIAAELLKAGVDTHELTTRIYDNRSLSAVKLNARAMLDLRTSPDRRIAWSAITEKMMLDTGAKGEDLLGMVDRIRSIEGVEVAILFREDKGRIKINFRSKERVNVSEIARRFGGGGHAKAAGAIVDGPLDKAQEKVVAEVQKHMEALKFLV